MQPARLALPLLVLATALAGCADDGAYDPGITQDDGTQGAGFHLEGTMRRGATQADLDEVRAVAGRHGADVTTQEADPPRFVLSGMTEGACESARAELEALSGVDSTGSCSDLPRD